MNEPMKCKKSAALVLVLVITVLTILFGASCNKNTPTTTPLTSVVTDTSSDKTADQTGNTLTPSPVPSGTTHPTVAPGEKLTLDYIISNSYDYKVVYSLSTLGEVEYEETYYCSSDAISFEYTDDEGYTYTDYLRTHKNGDIDYFYATDDGYYCISSSCSHFSEFDYASYHGFTPILLAQTLFTPSEITDKDGNGVFKFDTKKSDINSVCKSLFYDCDSPEESITELFKDLEITVSCGKIQSITATSEYNYDGEKTDCTHKLTYSYPENFEEVTLPSDFETVTDENYDELFGENNNDYPQMPNYGIKPVGETNAIVIPVEFPGYEFSDKKLSDLRIAFEGSESATGWESVQSYYSKSSYGKLKINYTFTDVYNVGMSVSDFEKLFDDAETSGEYFTPIENIIDTVLAKYESQLDLINDYDSNGDNMIDAVYLIYSVPFDETGESVLWWAWTYSSLSENYFENESGFVFPGYYIWASCDFMYEDFYGKGNVKVNATTYIHETGHLLGLYDYYDTDLEQGPAGGVGGGDMMDCNVGDHGAVSKLLLGWTNGTVLDKKDTTVQINDLVSSGDCIIIKKDDSADIYSEFILIDLFVPKSLNKDSAGVYGLPSKALVRIYHVDATLKEGSSGTWEYLEFEYDNSSTEHKFVKVIEADGNNSIESTENYDSGELAENSDYFKAGSTFGSNYKWYDGTSVSFTLTVDSIDSANGVATITFDFN